MFRGPSIIVSTMQEETTPIFKRLWYDWTQQQPGIEPTNPLGLSVEGKKISFKLDTGSEVNILSFHMYESHCSKTEFVPTKAKVVGYFGKSSKPHGKVLLHVEYKHKFYPVEFMVVDSKNPIIGLSTCEDLNLVRFVDEIKQSKMLCMT